MTGKDASSQFEHGHAGAASPRVDEESGQEPDSPESALFALEAMRQRGLISASEYDRRRRAIMAAGDRPCAPQLHDGRPIDRDRFGHPGAAGPAGDEEAGA